MSPVTVEKSQKNMRRNDTGQNSMVANRPQTLLPMSTANIPYNSLRKTANLRISEDCISHFATFFKHG